MTAQTTKDNVHEELLCHVFQGRVSEEDALLWMVLLRTHAIHLRPGVLNEEWANGQNGEPVVLSALTQRNAASVIAALWPRRNEERANYAYWYVQFNTRTPYELLGDVPEDLKPRLLQFRELLAKDPRVLAVIEED